MTKCHVYSSPWPVEGVLIRLVAFPPDGPTSGENAEDGDNTPTRPEKLGKI